MHKDNTPKSSNTDQFLKDLNIFFDLLEKNTNHKIIASDHVLEYPQGSEECNRRKDKTNTNIGYR